MKGSPSVAIVGAGGHAVSVTEAVTAMGYTIAYYVSEHAASDAFLGRPVRHDVDSINIDPGFGLVLAIGENSARSRVWQRLSTTLPLATFPAIVHPSATVAQSVELGPASVVLQAAVIGAGSKVSAGCLVNTRASLDHESTLHPFASMAPGAVTGGRVEIGARAALCIGACVKHGVSIGEDTVVGAASYVHKDLPPGVVAYGVPARVIRSRVSHDPYLA
jgi:sugar O-acyltransferase (sialic acid O-acetyltransferase NeuD family)